MRASTVRDVCPAVLHTIKDHTTGLYLGSSETAWLHDVDRLHDVDPVAFREEFHWLAY
jgi:hypothetical protein